MGEEYSVAVGDQLKGLDYKVTDVEVRSTEDKDGNPVDDSIVTLRNTKSGQNRCLDQRGTCAGTCGLRGPRFPRF